MSAVRLARAATGRDVVVKFAGAYHGHSDGLLAEAGSGLATLGDPGAAPACTAAQAADTVVVPWNDREAVERALAEHPVAALLAEPIAANMGVVPPAEGFLEFLLRALADAHGALLVFDEVITGFRVARGGAQELYGVERRPDRDRQGARRRPAGGRLRRPARADGADRPGRRRLPGGHALGQPARDRRRARDPAQLDAAAYERLGELTDRLAAGLRRARPATGRCSVASAPGLVTLFFSAEPVARLRRRRGLRPRRPRALLPRDARPRRLPAAVRSSRPGSSRSPTTRRRSTAPSRPPPRRSTRRS